MHRLSVPNSRGDGRVQGFKGIVIGLTRGLFVAGLVLAGAAPVFCQANIVGIEVNQALGLQFSGNLNFVAGKDTAIRVFLDASAQIDSSPDQTSLDIVRD